MAKRKSSRPSGAKIKPPAVKPADDRTDAIQDRAQGEAVADDRESPQFYVRHKRGDDPAITSEIIPFVSGSYELGPRHVAGAARQMIETMRRVPGPWDIGAIDGACHEFVRYARAAGWDRDPAKIIERKGEKFLRLRTPFEANYRDLCLWTAFGGVPSGQWSEFVANVCEWLQDWIDAANMAHDEQQRKAARAMLGGGSSASVSGETITPAARHRDLETPASAEGSERLPEWKSESVLLVRGLRKYCKRGSAPARILSAFQDAKWLHEVPIPETDLDDQDLDKWKCAISKLSRRLKGLIFIGTSHRDRMYWRFDDRQGEA